MDIVVTHFHDLPDFGLDFDAGVIGFKVGDKSEGLVVQIDPSAKDNLQMVLTGRSVRIVLDTSVSPAIARLPEKVEVPEA